MRAIGIKALYMKALAIKLFCLTAVIFTATSAMAYNYETPDFPKIRFGSTFVGIDEVCVAGESVHTIRPVPVCEEYNRVSRCVSEVRSVLSTPIRYTSELPLNGNRFEKVGFTIPLNYSVPFVDARGRVVYSRSFRIPNCQ